MATNQATTAFESISATGSNQATTTTNQAGSGIHNPNFDHRGIWNSSNHRHPAITVATLISTTEETDTHQIWNSKSEREDALMTRVRRSGGGDYGRRVRRSEEEKI
ncbi:unnamed protein product [Rhodiola kirilowii]